MLDPELDLIKVRSALGSTGKPPAAGLAHDLSEFARELRAEATLTDVLQRIVITAVRECAPASFAGISEIRGTVIETRAGTAEIVHDLDAEQYKAGDGPCLTSLHDQVTVRSDSLAEETRWPEFTARALERGVTSMLAVQLFVEDDNLGALNLYGTGPAAFAEDDENTAMLLATHASVAMKGRKTESNLIAALENRDVIGQAKGILMERLKIGQSEAFELLVVASQHTHRKLRDVAEELAATGELRIR